MKNKKLDELMESHGHSIEEMQNRHPGYRFRSCGPEESIYEKDGGELLIEVKGKTHKGTIAVLRGNEAVAYKMLQWHSAFASHPAVAVPRLIMSLIAITVLTITQIIAGGILLKQYELLSSYPIAFLIAIAPSLILSICEVILLGALKHWLKGKIGMYRLYSFIKNTPDYNRERYCNLFRQLSKCKSEDKRSAAAKMAKFLC